MDAAAALSVEPSTATLPVPPELVMPAPSVTVPIPLKVTVVLFVARLMPPLRISVPASGTVVVGVIVAPLAPIVIGPAKEAEVDPAARVSAPAALRPAPFSVRFRRSCN